MPSLPARPVAAPSPKPSFGEELKRALSHIFDHRFENTTPLRIGSRTQVMIFSQEPIDPLPGFTPDLQIRYPEAHALAKHVDKFEKEQVVLLRVTVENHPRPHLFLEFWLHFKNQEPHSLKIKALVFATIKLAKEYGQHRMDQPFQSQVDIAFAVPRVVGGLVKDTFQLTNYLNGLSYPEDPISRKIGERVDDLAATIDSFYVKTAQRVNPE